MSFRDWLALTISCVAAIALGWVLPYLQFYAMQFFMPVTPLPRLLHELGFEGTAFSMALYPFDFAFHVISSLPVALGIYALRPRHLLLYTLLAVLPYFFALFGLLFLDGALDSGIGIIQSAMTSLLVLPCGVLLVHWAWRKARPNDSFKRMPGPRPA